MEQNQDLRSLFEKNRESENYKLNSGHKDRFLQLLEKELPKKSISFKFFIRIAACILLLVSAGIFWYAHNQTETMIETTIVDKSKGINEINGISLGDLSPDLKKIEQYYVATINLELAQLEISEENRSLVESYMERLAELNSEYQLLIKELNTVGPNDQTISALIQNLQLRLQLLQKLKEKLNELKSSKNETAISI
jgi:hypothetical protein